MRKPFFVVLTLIIVLFLMAGYTRSNHPVLAATPSATAILTKQPEVFPTIFVNTTVDDSGSCPQTCTLRGAIQKAGPGDIVGFDVSLTGTITLKQTLVITKNVTIVGPGAAVLSIDSDKKFGVIAVEGGATVSISDIAVQQGNDTSGPGGGGLYIANGTVTLSNVTVANNSAQTGGGGLFINGGTAILINVTIANNNAQTGGGGLLINYGTVALINTTVASNTTQFDNGGGIYSSSGVLTIRNSTIAGNEAQDGNGGGMYVRTGSSVEIGSTIIANNKAKQGVPDLFGKIKSTGYNLIGNPKGAVGLIDSDQTNVDPKLGPLAANAPGKTQTMALLAGSPAIGKGGTNCPDTDQRGIKRKTPCDVGAYESGL